MHVLTSLLQDCLVELLYPRCTQHAKSPHVYSYSDKCNHGLYVDVDNNVGMQSIGMPTIFLSEVGQAKKRISSNDARLKDAPQKQGKVKKKKKQEVQVREVTKASSSLFFQYNTNLRPPFQKFWLSLAGDSQLSLSACHMSAKVTCTQQSEYGTSDF